MSTSTPTEVRKQITVEASQALAFDVFVDRIGDWWPLATHHIRGEPPQPERGLNR